MHQRNILLGLSLSLFTLSLVEGLLTAEGGLRA
jgi:hypothetical protein